MSTLKVSPQSRRIWPLETMVQQRRPPKQKRLPPQVEWPFRTGALDTIDRAMDIQQLLFEISMQANLFFRLPLLFVMLTAFMMIVFDCYSLLDLFTKPNKKFWVSKDDGLVLIGYQIVMNVRNILGVVIACGMLRDVVRQTGAVVHKIMIVSRNDGIRERMMQFSLQIRQNMPSFTAFEMFEFDGTLVYGIVGAATTYLIILVQYSSSNPELSQDQTHHHNHNHSHQHNHTD